MKTVEAEIVEDNQIVLSEIKYPVSRVDLNVLKKEYEDIPDIDPDADENIVGEQYQFVLKGHKAFVKARTSIENTRKTLKKPALEYGKKVDEIAKEFQATINGVEEKLLIQRKKVEDNEARKQREAEELEEARIDKIKGLILDVKNLPLQHFNSNSEMLTNALESLRTITKEVYEEFFDEAVENQNFVISQLQTARSNRLAVENAEAIQAEAKAKADAEEAEKQVLRDAEQKKLDDERAEFQKQKDDFEAQQKAAREEQDRQQAERDADELMKQQEQIRKEKSIASKIKIEEMKKEAYKCIDENLYDDNDEVRIDFLVEAVFNGNVCHLAWED